MLDAKNVFVLLIGVPEYQPYEKDGKSYTLHSLPAAKNNVEKLREIFTNKYLCGIPEQNIHSFTDNVSEKRILQTLAELTSDDNPRLIFYYSGHGWQNDQDLYLACYDTNESNFGYNSMSCRKINELISQKRWSTLFLFDCCFSEQAFDSIKNFDYAAIASSDANHSSIYPVGETYSAFTGELIDICEFGIGKDVKDIVPQDLHEELKNRLLRKNFPEPKFNFRNILDNFPIVLNKLFNPPIEQIDDRLDLIKVFYDHICEFRWDKEKVEEERKILAQTNNENLKRSLLRTYIVAALPFPIGNAISRLYSDSITFLNLKRLYENIIRFLCFAYISQLSQAKYQSESSLDIDDADLETHLAKPDNTIYRKLIDNIQKTFLQNNLAFFIEEFNPLSQDFINIVKAIESKLEDYKTSSSNLNPLIDDFFKLALHLAFLAKYQFISVREIKFQYRKYIDVAPEYAQEISFLVEGSAQPYVFNEKFILKGSYSNCHSVLLTKFRENGRLDYLNFCPLMIDRNAFIKKANEAKIYFYFGKEGDKFQYQSLSGDSWETRYINELMDDTWMEVFNTQFNELVTSLR